MATTLTFAPKKLTIVTAGNAEKLTFPAKARAAILYGEAKGVQFSKDGTDGAAIGNDHMLTAVAVPFVLDLDPSVYGDPAVLFVSHGDINGVVRVCPLRRRALP